MSFRDPEELYKDLPEIIESPFSMDEANAQITLYNGRFTVSNPQRILEFEGRIFFNWVASSGCHFQGECYIQGIPDFFQSIRESYSVSVKGLDIGEAYIQSASFADSNNIAVTNGRMRGKIVLDDRSVPVTKLRFSIPNLRSFRGEAVKKRSNGTLSLHSNRLTFSNEKFNIIIDRRDEYNTLLESLKAKGGFAILYFGTVTPKGKSSISFEELDELFDSFNIFISFLNGRRTSAHLIEGIFEEEIKWLDCTDFMVDPYKYVPSWPQEDSTNGLDKIWGVFTNLWKDIDDRGFLNSAVHWYVEANSNSGLTEGSLIMAQTALELIYNWWIIEQKQMIVGKDSENLSASNKIRMLLSQLSVDYTVPASFGDLQKFVDDNDSIADAPEAIVQIRNAIVHSQEEKRRKLSSIHYLAKHQALQLSIWYIELSLLKILGFDGKYSNRCAGKAYAAEAEMFVPWSNH